jgi:hypothetical protein
MPDPHTPPFPSASPIACSSHSAAKAASAALAIVLLALGVHWAPSQQRLLLAPMIAGLEPCYAGIDTQGPNPRPDYARECMRDGASAAPLVEVTLQQLGPRVSRDDRLEVGYTLPLALLSFLKPAAGDWEVDRQALHRAIQTIADEDRRLVLYLFSTHFSAGSAAEQALSKDPSNLLVTRQGPLAMGKYFGVDIIPWSFVRTDNAITRAREKVVAAVLDEVCALPPQAQQRITAITLLGELHHMFPDLEGGMGFAPPYLITDYSEASVLGFRRFLADRFGSIARLNAALGTKFQDFKLIVPPSKDIRAEPAAPAWEHMDAYAHGVFQVSGWTHVAGLAPGNPPWIRIYRNGSLVGRVAANQSRQDVTSARPEFKTADVGWAFNLDYSEWPPGNYRIDALLEIPGQPSAQLATRTISVRGPVRVAASQSPAAALPALQPLPTTASFAVDSPAEHASYDFNPLARLWHAFRHQQVRDYLAHFQRIVARSCIPEERVYSHQILPDVNPGWDINKFATGGDLGVPSNLNLGVSLYGEASYGQSFVDRLTRLHRANYGITEFHPLKPLPMDELQAAFLRHRAKGARFLSFFVNGKGLLDSHPALTNPFSFDPDNPKFGSDQLYEGVRHSLQTTPDARSNR